MPANPIRNVSTTAFVTPEFRIKQEALDRRKKLGEALLQQGLEVPEGQMVSGRYVAPSPLLYAAKLGQILLARNGIEDLDQQQIDLAKEQNKFMGDEADKLAYATTPRSAMPAETFTPDGDGMGPAGTRPAQPAYNPGPAELAKAMTQYLNNIGMPDKAADLVVSDARQRMLVNMLKGDSASAAGGSLGPIGNEGGGGRNSVRSVMNGASAASFFPGGGSTDGTGQTSASYPATGSTTGNAPFGGLPTHIVQGLMIADPTGKSLTEAIAKNAELTPEIKNNNWMGYTPQNAYQAKIAADMKAGEVERKPLNQFKNFYTGESGMVPKIPDGTEIIGGIARNGSIPGGVRLVPGAAYAVARNAYAGAIGNAGAKPTTKIDANGRVISTNEADLATGGQGAPGSWPGLPADNDRVGILKQELADEIAKPLSNGYAQRDKDANIAGLNRELQRLGAGSAPQYSPKLPEGSDAVIKGYTDRHNAAINLATTAPQDIDALKKISAIAEQTKTGPGQAKSQVWRQYVNLIPGVRIDNKDADNMAALKKYVSSMADQGLNIGTGSDAQLKNKLDALPNDGLPNGAIIKDIVPYLVAQKQAIIARANAGQSYLVKNGNNPAVLGEFEQKWRQAFDPRAYQLNTMSPEERKAYVTRLSPQDARALQQKRQLLKELGAL